MWFLLAARTPYQLYMTVDLLELCMTGTLPTVFLCLNKFHEFKSYLFELYVSGVNHLIHTHEPMIYCMHPASSLLRKKG